MRASAYAFVQASLSVHSQVVVMVEETLPNFTVTVQVLENGLLTITVDSAEGKDGLKGSGSLMADCALVAKAAAEQKLSAKPIMRVLIFMVIYIWLPSVCRPDEIFSVTQNARYRELGFFSFAEAGLSMLNPRVVSWQPTLPFCR